MQNWLKYENLQVWQCLGVTVSFPFISSDLNANAFSVIFWSAKYILTIYSNIIILKIVENFKISTANVQDDLTTLISFFTEDRINFPIVISLRAADIINWHLFNISVKKTLIAQYLKTWNDHACELKLGPFL